MIVTSDDDNTDNILQAFVANHYSSRLVDKFIILAAKQRGNQRQKPSNCAASIMLPIELTLHYIQ